MRFAALEDLRTPDQASRVQFLPHALLLRVFSITVVDDDCCTACRNVLLDIELERD